MIHEFWLLLLPVAAVSGWLASSTRMSTRPGRHKNIPIPSDYLLGLNFLLDEEPDKALDIFIKLLEVDSETVETHLALGNLFRRRGEVDRAIRIHQNLIARPTLSRVYRAQALLALAIDYFSAGVLDRAERLFLELVNLGEHEGTSLKYLLSIYEQEHEWRQAIHIAKKLKTRSTGEALFLVIAHYYCELAEIEMKRNDFNLARKYLRQAVSIDRLSVRASLLSARIEIASGRFKHAIRHLKYVKNQNPDFLSETVFPLEQSFRALGWEKALFYYLRDILAEFPKIPIALMLSGEIQKWRGDRVAANFVLDYVKKHPSIQGVHRLIALHLSLTEGKAREDLSVLYGLTQKILGEFPPYRCGHCGFSSKTLHWQCPTCKRWSTIKPAYVLEK